MKKVIAAAGIGAALATSVLLTSCSSSDDTEFIRRLNSQGIHYNSEAKAINGAHNVCDYLDKGYDVDSATVIVMDVVGNPYDAGYIVGASVGVYCPNYGYQIA